MLSEIFRPLLRTLFWNRRRPWVAAAILLALLVIISRLAGCGAAQGSAVPVPAASAPAAPAPSAAGTGAPASAAAVTVAAEFAQAWASRAPGRDQAIRSLATAQLAARLTGPSSALSPVTQITGPLTVTAHNATTVTLAVPTDAGPAVLAVTLDGGRWLATQVTLTTPGN